MDSDDDQMFAIPVKEEAVASDDEDNHLMTLSYFLGLYARNAQLRRGGLKLGTVREIGGRSRMEVYCMLYADYIDCMH
jgi:hypothetical protein